MMAASQFLRRARFARACWWLAFGCILSAASLSCLSSHAPSTSSPVSALIKLASPTGTSPAVGSSTLTPISVSCWEAQPACPSPIGTMSPLIGTGGRRLARPSCLSPNEAPAAITSSSLPLGFHLLPTARVNLKRMALVWSLPRFIPPAYVIAWCIPRLSPRLMAAPLARFFLF